MHLFTQISCIVTKTSTDAAQEVRSRSPWPYLNRTASSRAGDLVMISMLRSSYLAADLPSGASRIGRIMQDAWDLPMTSSPDLKHCSKPSLGKGKKEELGHAILIHSKGSLKQGDGSSFICLEEVNSGQTCLGRTHDLMRPQPQHLSMAGLSAL